MSRQDGSKGKLLNIKNGIDLVERPRKRQNVGQHMTIGKVYADHTRIIHIGARKNFILGDFARNTLEERLPIAVLTEHAVICVHHT